MADAKMPPVILNVPQMASVLTALDMAIDKSRTLDNIAAFVEAKSVILNQIGA